MDPLDEADVLTEVRDLRYFVEQQLPSLVADAVHAQKKRKVAGHDNQGAAPKPAASKKKSDKAAAASLKKSAVRYLKMTEQQSKATGRLPTGFAEHAASFDAMHVKLVSELGEDAGKTAFLDYLRAEAGVDDDDDDMPQSTVHDLFSD